MAEIRTRAGAGCLHLNTLGALVRGCQAVAAGGGEQQRSFPTVPRRVGAAAPYRADSADGEHTRWAVAARQPLRALRRPDRADMLTGFVVVVV